MQGGEGAGASVEQGGVEWGAGGQDLDMTRRGRVEMIVICSSPVGAWLQRRRWGRWPFPGCSPRPSGSGRWTWRRRRWKRRTWRRGAAGAAGGRCSLLHLCYEDKGESLWSAIAAASLSQKASLVSIGRLIHASVMKPDHNLDHSLAHAHQRIRSQSGRA